MTARPRPVSTDEAYVARRIVDCCLREDLRGLIERGRRAEPDAALLRAWPHEAPPFWWRVAHLPGGMLWIPAEPRDYMQAIGTSSHGWLHERDGVARYEDDAARWLERLGEALDDDTVALHRQYAEEAACAAAHRRLAREGYAAHADRLVAALTHADDTERALLCDQVASYRDHPFYPTARAKSGFGDDDLRAYAPEFAPTFALCWLAVPKASLTLTTPAPSFWPSMADVGLPPGLEATHAVLPVHPLTWDRLDAFELPEGTLRAPDRFLSVRPTLSVRTVVPVAHPRHHVKLPLLMRTLGALNLRLIKPSTIYDGHWFERVLRHLGDTDPALRGRYVHVDESHGGHADEARHLAYIVRTYPASQGETLVPVAAFCAPMPDGRPLALHVADRFHRGDVSAWWSAYVALMCDIHLRLWLRHGIALESNQQNAVLAYRHNGPPVLLMKDNDAARVRLDRLHATSPSLKDLGLPRDPRISVDGDDALARMFCTITLQLCLLAVLEGVAEHAPGWRRPFYAVLAGTLDRTLQTLAAEGIDVSPARRLLDGETLPVKYLLSAGSLLSKQATGATDINKFYGDSGPNFMRDPALRGAR
ncbi:IucA/IucC family siderophore biosynthesis protein [Luteibacter aegosomatis]|uniref:IucA/IucC family protein n=1 Tax=Luteibacter aegosomatis TaxID=2911537 RepID=UPI001FF78833|nr:IucA/IucC family protein [Luteibacter aegosomatis]UPG83996.1 IucA/IucC family siderophore biosynthesis protein [Luteibacter aegosomatis]